MAGNFAERRKIRQFSFNYVILEKEKLRSPFLPFSFFKEKTKSFLLTFNNLQNISPRLYFLGVLIYMKKAQFKFEFASVISGIFGKRDLEKSGTSREFGNGNS